MDTHAHGGHTDARETASEPKQESDSLLTPARLAALERLARAATEADGADWEYHDGPRPNVYGRDGKLAMYFEPATAEHIAANDPCQTLALLAVVRAGRVLAEALRGPRHLFNDDLLSALEWMDGRLRDGAFDCDCNGQMDYEVNAFEHGENCAALMDQHLDILVKKVREWNAARGAALAAWEGTQSRPTAELGPPWEALDG